MLRFSDNYPDITPPNVVSGGFRFDHRMEDEWDYYLASVFGDVETLARIRAANPQIDGTMHYEFPLIMAVRNGRTDAVRFLLEADNGVIDSEPATLGNVWYSRCVDAAKKRGFDEIHKYTRNDKRSRVPICPPLPFCPPGMPDANRSDYLATSVSLAVTTSSSQEAKNQYAESKQPK